MAEKGQSSYVAGAKDNQHGDNTRQTEAMESDEDCEPIVWQSSRHSGIRSNIFVNSPESPPSLNTPRYPESTVRSPSTPSNRALLKRKYAQKGIGEYRNKRYQHDRTREKSDHAIGSTHSSSPPSSSSEITPAMGSIYGKFHEGGESAQNALTKKEEAHRSTRMKLRSFRGQQAEFQCQFKKSERFARPEDTAHLCSLEEKDRLKNKHEAPSASYSEYVEKESFQLHSIQEELDMACAIITHLRSEAVEKDAEVTRTSAKVKQLRSEINENDAELAKKEAFYDKIEKNLSGKLQSAVWRERNCSQTLAKVNETLKALALGFKKLAPINTQITSKHASMITKFQGLYEYLPEASTSTRKEIKAKFVQENEELRKLIKSENTPFVDTYLSLKKIIDDIGTCTRKVIESSSSAHANANKSDLKRHEILPNRDMPQIESERPCFPTDERPTKTMERIGSHSKFDKTLADVTDTALHRTSWQVKFNIPSDPRHRMSPRRTEPDRPSTEVLDNIGNRGYCNDYHLHGGCSRRHCIYLHGSPLKGGDLDALRYLENPPSKQHSHYLM